MAKLIGMFHQKGNLAAQKRDETILTGRNIPENRERDDVRNQFQNISGKSIMLILTLTEYGGFIEQVNVLLYQRPFEPHIKNRVKKVAIRLLV